MAKEYRQREMPLSTSACVSVSRLCWHKHGQIFALSRVVWLVMDLPFPLLGCSRRSQWITLLLPGGLWPLWLGPGLATSMLWGFRSPVVRWMLTSPEDHHVSYEWLLPTIWYVGWFFQNTEGTDTTNIVTHSKLIVFGPWVLLKGK